MSRRGDSAGKRRVTAQRDSRKATKSQRRQQRQADSGSGPVDQTEMMSQFHHLNELRSAGSIAEDVYERQRHDIFVSLGLEDP